MGLLEKALKYKNRINIGGKKTLMDRIKGPADADEAVEVIKLGTADLIEVTDNDFSRLGYVNTGSEDDTRTGREGPAVEPEEASPGKRSQKRRNAAARRKRLRRKRMMPGKVMGSLIMRCFRPRQAENSMNT